jgi:CheY-like chemotaxis protein
MTLKEQAHMVHNKVILLVEDNNDDEVLTLRALKKNHIANAVIVARDGVEALDFLFGTGTHAGRDTRIQPQLVLLDLNLPRIDGLEVLKRLRADERTQFLAVVVLTSSKEEEDVIRSYANGANAYVRKPVEFERFSEAVSTLGCFWLLLNESAPQTTPRAK